MSGVKRPGQDGKPRPRESLRKDIGRARKSYIIFAAEQAEIIRLS